MHWILCQWNIGVNTYLCTTLMPIVWLKCKKINSWNFQGSNYMEGSQAKSTWWVVYWWVMHCVLCTLYMYCIHCECCNVYMRVLSHHIGEMCKGDGNAHGRFPVAVLKYERIVEHPTASTISTAHWHGSLWHILFSGKSSIHSEHHTKQII